MLKSKFFKALLVTSVFLSLPCCKKELKYPEDPKKSNATPEERLDGKWNIIEYTFNGNSIYNKLNQAARGSFNLNTITLHFEVKKHDNYDQGVVDLLPIGGDNCFGLNETNFKFYAEKGNDSLFGYWFVTPFRYAKTGNANWTVTKLYGTDFKIVLPTDSGEYKIHWSRIQ